MSLTCPKCSASGEFVTAEIHGNDRGTEIRKCRNCGWVYTIELDVDDDGYPEQEPYTIDDDTWGRCPECGSGLENSGACSDGDGDLYDELICPLCQEPRGRANERWFDDDGNEI